MHVNSLQQVFAGHRQQPQLFQLDNARRRNHSSPTLVFRKECRMTSPRGALYRMSVRRVFASCIRNHASIAAKG